MINEVTLAGNLGKDPEIHDTKTGSKVASMTLATTESFKNSAGEWEKKTEWHKIVAFGKSAEYVQKYLSKGMKIYVQGKIAYRSYEKDGVKKFSTEILSNKIIMLDKPVKVTTATETQSQPADSDSFSDMPF